MTGPTFLLRNISESLREHLEADAKELDRPLQEVVRSILCAHYSLDCGPKQGKQRDEQWTGAQTILLKDLPTELFAAIKKDAKETGESMRSLLIQALENHYQEVRT